MGTITDHTSTSEITDEIDGNEEEIHHLPAAGGERKLTLYKEKQKGSKAKRWEKESGDWVRADSTPKPLKRQFKIEGCRGVAVGLGTAADKMLMHYGVGAKTDVEVNAEKAQCDVAVTEKAGLKFLNAGAEYKAGHASAGASATPVQAKASALASGAEASARAGLIEGVVEANARAVAAEAKARAGVGLEDLGARAGASATLAKVETGITNVPFANASASGPGAEAETGISWKYTGASAGAHVAEAQAGPFAIRAGVKFGGGFRNGVPEVDLGPVTCSIM